VDAQRAAVATRRRALPALRGLVARVVRLQRRWLVVCAVCLVWAGALAGLARGQAGTPPDPPQPWHRLEATAAHAIYYGDVAAAPVVTGAQVACADNDSGGLTCVLYAPGAHRLIIADGMIVEDSRARLFLPAVAR
jgi:hypothetical protein